MDRILKLTISDTFHSIIVEKNWNLFVHPFCFLEKIWYVLYITVKQFEIWEAHKCHKAKIFMTLILFTNRRRSKKKMVTFTSREGCFRRYYNEEGPLFRNIFRFITPLMNRFFFIDTNMWGSSFVQLLFYSANNEKNFRDWRCKKKSLSLCYSQYLQ